MKTLPLVINAVLTVAIAVLYYFQFAANDTVISKNMVDSVVVDSVSATLKIAYVDQDSLLSNYKLIDDLQERLEVEKGKSERKIERRAATLEAQLEQMARELQEKAAQFDQQAQGMNEALRNMKMQELQSLQENARGFSMQAEQDVAQLQQKEQMELLQLEAEGTALVSKNMKRFLKEYNTEYGFSFILAYSDQAGGILLGNPALNITTDVINGLNAIYDAEKAAEQAVNEK